MPSLLKYNNPLREKIEPSLKRIKEAKERELYFYLQSIEGPSGPRVRINGIEKINLSSYNYPSIVNHPKIIKAAIKATPRRFIAQELIEFYDEKCYLDKDLKDRKADFRAYVVMGEDIKVWQCGLTRYALEAGNYLVNSSQGGGFKDTWVMEL